MRLPIQTSPVVRTLSSIHVSAGGVMMSSKKDVTGKCVCKKGSSVLWTASSTICTTDDHDGCTAAKDECVSEHLTDCSADGGILTHSGASCTYGAKC